MSQAVLLYFNVHFMDVTKPCLGIRDACRIIYHQNVSFDMLEAAGVWNASNFNNKFGFMHRTLVKALLEQGLKYEPVYSRRSAAS